MIRRMLAAKPCTDLEAEERNSQLKRAVPE
jgi:hypothetical protein